MVPGKIKKEIEKRKENKWRIREKINQYCKAEYGISNFFSLVDENFRNMDSFAICLARQIPTVNIEHLAKNCLAKWLTKHGVLTTALPLALLDDSFNGTNPLKKSYIHIPIAKRGRSGKINIQNTCILERKGSNNLNGVSLSNIKTRLGGFLHEYHFERRKKILGSETEEVIDLSAFFKKCLKESINSNAKNKPEHVYVEMAYNGSVVRQVRTPIRAINGSRIVRPPANWYYFIYLLLFVDGDRALLSTIDDDETVNGWFEAYVDLIEKICGFKPFIIDTPKKVKVEGIESSLLEMPIWVQENPRWQEKINYPGELSFFDACEYIERQLIQIA